MQRSASPSSAAPVAAPAPRVLGEVPGLVAARAPERVALVEGDRHVTFAELERRTTALAGLLIERGVRPGDRVGLLLSNSSFMEAYLATAKTGAIAVPVGTRLSEEELTFLLAHSGSALLLHDASTAAMARRARVGALLDLDDAAIRVRVEATGATDPADARHPADARRPAGARHAAGAADAPAPVLPPVDPEDDAAIFYTSGTTASPKGARLTHRAILTCAAIVSEAFEIGERDVALAVLPLYHTATHFIPLPTLIAGGTVVLEEGFRVGRAFELLERHRVTLFPTVTAIAILMAKHVHSTGRACDFGALRKVFIGGAGVPPTLLDDWAAFAPRTAIVNCYGLTEMAPGVACMDPSRRPLREGTVGVPYRGVTVRIQADDGSEAAPGEVGEILLKGDSQMSGYWDNPAATAAALRDGWLHTGDLGSRDADGYLTIAGRKKHMLKRGGENVFPDEVEAALIRHPGVKEAIVVGVPDEVMGERVGAIVAPQAGARPDPRELAATCAAVLADFKVPELVAVLDAELPKNSVGKVDARALHAAARAGEVAWTDLRRGRAGQATRG